MGKTGRKNKVYSAEFKIGVIMDMREHHLSYHETVRKYWGIEESNNGDSKRNIVQRWERISSLNLSIKRFICSRSASI